MAAAAKSGVSLIERPCWVQDADTPAGLALVHVWNGLIELRRDAADDGEVAAAQIGTHLAALCLTLCPIDSERRDP